MSTTPFRLPAPAILLSLTVASGLAQAQDYKLKVLDDRCGPARP
jgi:hypothetical protein